jgi:hypothetical protein
VAKTAKTYLVEDAEKDAEPKGTPAAFPGTLQRLLDALDAARYRSAAGSSKTVGRATRTDRLTARCWRLRNGEQPDAQGSGVIRPASVARPERARAAGRDRPTPRARNRPPSLLAEDQVVTLAPQSRIPLRHFASSALDQIARARPAHGVPRRRALEACTGSSHRPSRALGAGCPVRR